MSEIHDIQAYEYNEADKKAWRPFNHDAAQFECSGCGALERIEYPAYKEKHSKDCPHFANYVKKWLGNKEQPHE